jgi:VWFA-related protein
MRLPALALATVLGVSAVLLAAADAPAPITLDVVVVDAQGRAIETLTAPDFIITAQGAPLTVDEAHYIRVSPSATVRAAPVALAAAGQAADPLHVNDHTRLFGIFLDEYHITPGPAADAIQAALVRFVNQDLGPDDLVVVLKPLDSLVAITLTGDRAAATAAIERFVPRRGDYTPRTPFEKELIAGAPARIDAARAQIVTSSLNALAMHLGKFSPGRKTLIFVSEGFAPREIRRGGNVLPGFPSVTLTANQAHVAIYPIDPSSDEDASQSDGRRGAREALRALATDTAGRIAVSPTDGMPLLTRALRDASGYYILTVSPQQAVRDGRFHPVDVSVRRRDVTVQARQGYWAASEAERLAVAPVLPFLSSYAFRIPRRSSPLIRSWFGMTRSDSGATRVNFVWEPAPRVPGDRVNRFAPAQIALSVTTLDGAPVFDGVVLPSNAPSDARGQMRASFDIPSEHLLVQMAIKDAAARVLDHDVRDLVVLGFRTPVALGTAEVLRARTAREARTLAADPDAVPVAARQFSRTDRLLVRVPVFTTNETPVVTARLMSGFGSVMRDLPVTLTPSRQHIYQIDLPLAALASGGYAVEIRATTSIGNAHDSLLIHVTP